MIFKDHQFTEIKNTKLFIQNLPELLKNNAQDHLIYFVTFTFENSKIPDNKIDYQLFFKKMSQKINQHLNVNKKNAEKSCKLILVPEVSLESDATNFTHRHYHGFLLIHKNKSEKFLKSCVKNQFICTSANKETLALEDCVLSPFSLSDKLKNAFRTECPNTLEAHLKISTHRAYALSDTKDFERTTHYCFKKFAQSSYANNDILMLVRTKTDLQKR